MCTSDRLDFRASYLRLPEGRFFAVWLVVSVIVGLNPFNSPAVGAESVPAPWSSSASLPGSSALAQRAAHSGVGRIERPRGGFSPHQANAHMAHTSEEPDINAADQQTPVFARRLDGFSARWLHRLGTPVACRMVLCNGSCGDTDAACELTTPLPENSPGCHALPACDVGGAGTVACPHH